MNQQPPSQPSSPPPSAEAATDLAWVSTEPSGPGDDVLKQILAEMRQSRELLERIATSVTKQAVVVGVTESQEPAVHAGEGVIPGQDVQAKILAQLEGVRELLENVTDSGNAMFTQPMDRL